MPELNEKTEKKILEGKIAELQARISRSELAEQKMRSIQHKLDTQLDMLAKIHAYTQQAFHANDPGALNNIIAEGVVDIFQLEIGAVFLLNPAESKLSVIGSCNIDAPEIVVPFSKTWLQKQDFLNSEKHKILSESPVSADSPWAELKFSHVVYAPIINNDLKCEAIILGGISISGEKFYDLHFKEMSSPFMVYCQQMNGIYNNVSALKKAYEAGKAKTNFLANISHEIRTPLNAIIGMTQISKKNDRLGDLSKEIRQIEMSSKHLLSLINDILDISKIEEGKLSLVNEPFNLETVIGNIFESLKQAAESKHQNLGVKCDGLASYQFIGDSMRLSQVLINLLSNAIKFTPDGGNIDITVEELDRSPEKALLKFSVLDTGMGLSPEFMLKMFSPFEQADSSISRKFGGTGLGLAISRRLVELMGGRLQAESQVGQGANFYFSVRFNVNQNFTAQKNAEQPSDTPNFSDKIALVVDDIEINREIIFSMLSPTGIFIESAQNGEEALNLVKKSAEGYYDLILMDVQMPVMDGYTSTKLIRSLDRSDVKNITILALTANAFKEDAEQALNSGMNGHLSKPVDEDILLRTIASTFQKK